MYNQILGKALNYGQSMQPRKTKRVQSAVVKQPSKLGPKKENLRLAILNGAKKR